jgi:hypothetical protein
MSPFVDRIPESVDFYQEGDAGDFKIEAFGRYVKEKTGIPFRNRGNLYEGLSGEEAEEAAGRLARIRVKDPAKKFFPGAPLQGEIDYEKRRIGDTGWRAFGVFYDGIRYQEIVSRLIPEDPESPRCSILFTHQLFGTRDSNDRRYHARASLYGFPSLISTTGIVEAPAKPREYYLKKQAGIPVEFLMQEYEDRFVVRGDSRMTEILKGYAMQALFFHLLDEPFCGDRSCRLFNSHWQEELLHSQLGGRYEFCPRHEGVLRVLKNRKRSRGGIGLSSTCGSPGN